MDVWRRLLLAVVCGVAVATIYSAQPVLQPMGHDLGLPPENAGWIVSTSQFGYLTGLVLLVPLGDVVADKRRLIAVHLASTAVGLILTASASAAWVAFVGLAAAGCSRSWCRPRWPTPRRSRCPPNADGTSVS